MTTAGGRSDTITSASIEQLTKAFPATWKSPRVSSKEQKITKDVAVERFFFLMIRGHQKK